MLETLGNAVWLAFFGPNYCWWEPTCGETLKGTQQRAMHTEELKEEVWNAWQPFGILVAVPAFLNRTPFVLKTTPAPLQRLMGKFLAVFVDISVVH